MRPGDKKYCWKAEIGDKADNTQSERFDIRTRNPKKTNPKKTVDRLNGQWRGERGTRRRAG